MRGANEIRVGIVVVLALLVMGGGYFYLRGVGLGADIYYMRLNGAAQIANGSDVRLQGIRVGQVQEVTIDATQKPFMTLAIRRNEPRFVLAKNYSYSVTGSAVIGDNFVDIRGVYDPSAEAYHPNDPTQIIPGTAGGGIAGVTDQATALMKDMQKTLGSLNVTIQRINQGVLSEPNQKHLTEALQGMAQLSKQAQQSFGPQGVRLTIGDPQSQRALNAMLANASSAARQAGNAANQAGSAATAAAANVNRLTGDLSSVVGENRAQLRILLGTLNKTATNVAGLAQTLDFTVNKSGFAENANVALRAMRRSAENIESSTATFKAFTSDATLQKNLRDTVNTLNETTKLLRETTLSVKTLVTDPATQEQLKTTLATINTAATSLQATSENLRDTTAGFKNVFGDPKVQSDMKAIPAELKLTLATAQGAAEAARHTAEAAQATAERINAILGGRRKRTTPEQPGGEKAQRQGFAPGGYNLTLRHFLDPSGRERDGDDVEHQNYGDIDFNAELFGGPFRLGLANIGEGNDLTLQTGRFLGKNGAVRYGLFRSKLGVGADWHKGRFSLEGNLWNPNERSFNAYLGYRVTPQVEIIAGREHIRGVRTNAVGVRLTP